MLYNGSDARKTSFFSGYRPIFSVAEDTLVSGEVTLIDRSEFPPGCEDIVKISFLDADCNPGDLYHFYEGEKPLGECLVLEVIN